VRRNDVRMLSHAALLPAVSSLVGRSIYPVECGSRGSARYLWERHAAPGLHCTNIIYLHYYRLYQLYRYELTNRLFVYDMLLYAVGLWWIICMLLEIIRVISAVEMHG